MNFTKLFNTYHPQKKCGADPFSGGAILGSAGFSAGASVIQSLLGMDQNSKNLKAQRYENERNRQFNAEQADISRRWSAAQWNKQFKMQSDEWYNQQQYMQDANRQQFLFESNYNSPTNQIARLQQAGINPAAAGGANGLVAAATGNIQNVGSVSVPSGGSLNGAVASSSGSVSPNPNPWDFSSLGSFAKDLNDIAISNKKLQPEIDNLFYDTLKKKIDAQHMQYLVGLEEVNLEVARATKDTKIKDAYQEFRNHCVQEYLTVAMTGDYEQGAILKQAQAFLADAETKIKGKEYEVIAFQVAHQAEAWENMLANDKASRAQKYGSAALSNAQAQTENESRDFVVNLQQINRDIARLDWRKKFNETFISNATIQSEVKRITAQAVQAGIITKTMETQLEQAIFNKDWQLVDKIFGMVIETANTASKFVPGS